jgi:hypothetical protein
VYPNPNAAIEPLEANPKVFCSNDAKPFEPHGATVNHFLQNLSQRYLPPPKVFCSRDLEKGMTEFVRRELLKTGVFPSDDQMRSRARDIMGMQQTPVDDAVLLGKFKASLQQQHDMMATTPDTSAIPGAQAQDSSALLTDADLNMTDQEFNDILQGMQSNDELMGNGALI